MNAVVQFQAPRLPYHDLIEERFDVDKGAWKVLVESVFPAAKTPDAVVMALSYCKRRNLDIFKRPVHIVPMYSAATGGYVETVWPGISELRTTAFRTGQYAGCNETEFGPDLVRAFEGTVGRGQYEQTKKIEVSFPEWGRMTVWRMVSGVRVPFVGPKVYWLETYGKIGKSDLPNDMWAKRPRGQLEKCLEAAALRKAFPEEIGNELTAEEMAGQTIIDNETGSAAEQMKLVPPPAPKVAAEPEVIHVPESRQGRQPLPKQQARQEDDQFSPVIEEQIDAGKWLDDVCSRMRQAKTVELLLEIWDSDCAPREGEIPPLEFNEARDCFNECREKFGG